MFLIRVSYSQRELSGGAVFGAELVDVYTFGIVPRSIQYVSSTSVIVVRDQTLYGVYDYILDPFRRITAEFEARVHLARNILVFDVSETDQRYHPSDESNNFTNSDRFYGYCDLGL